MKSIRQTLSFLFFLLLLCSCSSSTVTNKDTVQDTALRTVITGMDYGDSVVVIGHKSPDCDAVCSAIVYADLLQRLGINAHPSVAGKVICEAKYVIDNAGLDAPYILSDATGLNMIMVDHSEFAQAVNNMHLAHIMHVVDHHGTGSVSSSTPLFYYAMPIGSTCSIVATMYKDLGIEITPKMARLMISGLISDTDSLTTVTTTNIDRAIFTELLKLSDISDISAYYQAMRKARTSFEGMSDEDILLSDFKEYDIEGVHLGIGSVFASEELGIEELCDRIRKVMPKVLQNNGLDMLFMMLGDRDANISHVPYCGEGAKEVAEFAFDKQSSNEGCIITSYISSRKAEFVPAITKGIIAWKNK
jgi:manganese-dependent inorganic pyrophosphatase